MLESWQNFYSWHDPAIMSIGAFQLRWYGLMYVTALFTGYLWGRKMVARGDWLPIKTEDFEAAFFWFVFGAVLGAKIGYVIVYDPNALYLLTRPWLIFNPFKESGKFVGISGLSYHGAITGAVIALLIFARRHKIAFWRVADLAAVSGSAGYAFGRLGNFFNAELLGRETAMPWGINVQGVLRHPSALYEAFLEGIVIFAILFALYKKRKFAGQMAIGYLMLYAVMRFIAEFWREPDAQLGFIAFGWLSMGQALSALMFALSLGVYLYLRRRGAKRK